MDYLAFLKGVHAKLAPSSYLEIGVRFGASLTLAHAPSIGIDPAYELRKAVRDDAALFRETSDDYFARPDPLAPLGGERPDLAFIDGMHLVEYALRDFVNVERHARWSSVVVFDDVLPRRQVEAARERRTKAWAGDVYKLVEIFRRHRPDLLCLQVDTEPTGVMLVLGLDPDSTALRDRHDAIARRAKTPDPQDVPRELLERRDALEPQAVLDASFWEVLRDARSRGMPRADGVKALRKAVRDDFGRRVSRRPLRALLPVPA
jgi:hypothetical protein